MSRIHRNRTPRMPHARYAARGMSLVELMIALLIGSLVLVSASAIFISNRQTYRATEGVGRVQENSRMAYEVMARDVREAGGNACGRNLLTVNVLNNPAALWWSNWNRGLFGYEDATVTPGLDFGTAVGTRLANTDAIDIMSVDSSSSVTVVNHNPTAAEFHVNANDPGVSKGDIAVVCDNRQMTLFQVTNVSNANGNIVHDSGGNATPGNCTKGLGYPRDCSSPQGTAYSYEPNPQDPTKAATLARLHAVRWYVGANANGGNSLYRVTLGSNGSGTATTTSQEIAEGVDNLQLQYLVGNADGTLPNGASYVSANAVTAANWSNVVAVRIVVTIASADRAGVGGARLQRDFSHVATLRNRLQ